MAGATGVRFNRTSTAVTAYKCVLSFERERVESDFALKMIFVTDLSSQFDLMACYLLIW